ncbi:MAG: hypothetical protein OXG53_16335 [Chloroflexi bacterium]|nr:hypothetical protein [Chloroflexota bacterium]
MYRFNVSICAKPLLILLAALLLSSATSAQVNNCCFVDRQCATYEEWNAGYYAFQNGQCVAPSQPAFRRSTPAQIDNCCFGGWQCGADDEWTSGYFAFQHDHCFSQSHWEEQWQRRQNGDQHNAAQRTSYSRQRQPATAQVRTPSNEGSPWRCFTGEGARKCWERRTKDKEIVSITIDLSDPNRRQDETDDGTPVIIDPDKSD